MRAILFLLRRHSDNRLAVNQDLAWSVTTSRSHLGVWWNVYTVALEAAVERHAGANPVTPTKFNAGDE